MKKKYSTIILSIMFAFLLPVLATGAATKTDVAKTTTPPTETTTAEGQSANSGPPPTTVTVAAPKAGETINWQVISSGGTVAASDNYSMMGTAGQTAAGGGASENYGVSHGFWAGTTSGSSSTCCIIRGDINHMGEPEPDITDLIYLVTYMFQEGPLPQCDEPYSPECLEHYFPEADVNGDGSCTPNITDLIYLVTYMFQKGPPLVPCP
jgi:hypothetical protein